MAAPGDIQRRRKDCLDMAVRAGGDPADIVRTARDFEAYVTDPRETISPEIEELIAAARCVVAGDEGSHLRLISALQAMGEPIR